MSIRNELISDIEMYLEEIESEGHSDIDLTTTVNAVIDDIENRVNEAKSRLEDVDSKDALEILTELSEDLY